MQTKFNSTLNNLIKKYSLKESVFAVGVSGGADSLALAIFLHQWGKAKIVALTVDHGLRKESAKEAQYVSRVMAQYGIEHHLLKWEGKKPSKGIEEAARQARYDLMEKWCTAHGIQSLFVGHHKQDQAETFLMRLQRGSGVYGLAAMAPVFVRGGIKIVRPLLDFFPSELQYFLKSMKVKWVNDPHNFSDDFLRVRIRKMLPKLDKEIGLSVDRINDTAKRMARVRNYLESQVSVFISENVSDFEDIVFGFDLKAFQSLHEEIGLRVLAELLQKTGGKVYVPRLENLEHLRDALLKPGFKSQTLSGCEIIRQGSKIWIVPEMKSGKILKKKDWESFLKKNPEYRKLKLLYKIRLCLASIKGIVD